MATFLRRISNVFTRSAAAPVRFPSKGYEVVSSRVTLEEEAYEPFYRGFYCPIDIGEVLTDRYQVLGKMGFGISSTVWLAQDLRKHQHVCLKVSTCDINNEHEFSMLRRLNETNPRHSGYAHVRVAYDRFQISREAGRHSVLVLRPTWESLKDLLRRNPTHRFTPALLKGALLQIFTALDYLHNECHIVHTDIKADNILQSIEDPSILKAFTQAELKQPSPRKSIHGYTIYASKPFDLPKRFGNVLLSDFGSAVSGEKSQDHDIQPDVYRCPEVMLNMPWNYPADIWNVGVMIWDLFEGKHMFYGYDPHTEGYSTRAHLAEFIGLLGPPPLDFIKRGKRGPEFFADDGTWKAEIDLPSDVSLENFESFMEGEIKVAFPKFMRRILQWKPEDRATAKQLLDDPWLNSPPDEEDYYNR